MEVLETGNKQAGIAFYNGKPLVRGLIFFAFSKFTVILWRNKAGK